MTDEQPTPPPLDLEAIEARWRRVSPWCSDGRHLDAIEALALVAEVRRLRVEVVEAEGEEMLAKIRAATLEADLAAARAALAHYADEENWTAPPGHQWDELDKGYYLGEGPGFRVARAALKECDDD